MSGWPTFEQPAQFLLVLTQNPYSSQAPVNVPPFDDSPFYRLNQGEH